MSRSSIRIAREGNVAVKSASAPLCDAPRGPYWWRIPAGQPVAAFRGRSHGEFIMRRSSPLLPMLVVALCGAGTLLYVQLRRSDDALRAAQRSEAETRQRYGQAVDDIAAIQD